MVTSVPAWFGSKGRTRKPLGLDITTITDTSGSMQPYIDFITSAAVYQSLETSLRSQNVGVSPQNENRYSFCVGANQGQVMPALVQIEADVVISLAFQTRWATGKQVIDNQVLYPGYSLTGNDGENIAASLNTIQVEAEERGYNTLNQRITIGGSDIPAYQAEIIDLVKYPSIYVGVHSLIFSEDNSVVDPPRPDGELVGMVYTTDTLGVAIYMQDTDIFYRENMPTSGISVRPVSAFNQLGILIDQAIATNGALYNIQFFKSPERYAQLTESLGNVLGKYLYSLT